FVFLSLSVRVSLVAVRRILTGGWHLRVDCFLIQGNEVSFQSVRRHFHAKLSESVTQLRHSHSIWRCWSLRFGFGYWSTVWVNQHTMLIPIRNHLQRPPIRSS